jgi:hypothetical protein
MNRVCARRVVHWIIPIMALGFPAIEWAQSEEIWRLVGEARQEGGEWHSLVSQSPMIDTLAGSRPQTLLPGSFDHPLEPRMAMVGGVVDGTDWRYYLCVAEPRIRLSFEPELELVVRDFVDQEGGPSDEGLTRVRLEADVESGCYHTAHTRLHQVGLPARALEVRFRVEYRPARPQLFWDEDSYSALGSDRFRLLLLPVPQLGVVRLEFSSDFKGWQRSAVLPTWFEHSESAPVFGPTWRYWYGDGSGRAPQMFFRISQLPTTPTTNHIAHTVIDVPGFTAEGQVISFGSDAEEVLVRARWTGSGAASALVQLGVTDGATSAWVTQRATSDPQVFADIIRLPAGGTNWTLFVRYAQ